MLVSFRWLSELLPQVTLDPKEVAEALTAVGLAVDGMEQHGRELAPVVLAEVVRIEPHPQREQLQLVTVATSVAGAPPGLGTPPREGGAGPDLITVVCGAKNVPEPGGLVVFAGVGTRLPGVPFELSRREIGGIASEGMLCSEAELGLADEREGILTFAPGAFAPGTRFIDAFREADDVIYELDVTPNRPDALGHLGVARDLAAVFKTALEEPDAAGLEESSESSASLVEVENEAPDACPRYGAAVVRGIQLGPSPDWMRWRLHRLGIRPISNVVDMTNWLLMESGQPLHAFDLRTIRGGKISVRRAAPGEKMTTLDDVERDLIASDLVIADGEGPSALAGIMGGAESEIREDTQDVLLECAYFEPRGIRRTARRLAMHTESSHRFERGCDHGATGRVIDRARVLLQTLAGGRPAQGVVRADGAAIELPLIELHGATLNRLLGVDVSFKESIAALTRLGFSVEYLVDTPEGPVASIRGASHRPDVAIEQDLIEEVARIRGLDNIPTVLPAIPPQDPRTSGELERLAACTAVELGLSEALTHAFVAAEDLSGLRAPAPVVTLENPLSADRAVLRTSLAPGLLEALRRARRRGEQQVRLFSIGAIFLPVSWEQPHSDARVRQPEDQGKLPYEQPTFCALLAGPRDEHLSLKPADLDIYDAKAVAVEMVERMCRRRADVRHVGSTERTAHLHPRGAAVISVNGTDLGVFGPLHPDVIEHFDLDGSALLVELNLATIEALGRVTPRYRPIPKLPAISRDLSLVVEESVPAGRVSDAILAASGELCESVLLASEFRGGSVPDGHRSLTFRVVYRDPNARLAPDEARTLTDKEVDAIVGKALDKAGQDVGASLRG